MSTPNAKILLRVNGIQAAFGFEFGLDSPRANEGRAGNPHRQANVSYSLVQRRDGQVVRHTLIDCGMGVVPSLLEFEHTYGVHVVHEVLLTHPHFDHFAQLDWLSMCLLRSGRPDQPRPLPIYASPECWENGPNRVHRHLAERSDFHPLQPDIAVLLGDIAVTPFAVDHGPKAPGAVGLVVQHGSRKIVIMGDFLRVPEEDNPLLFGADVMFLDANTWHPAEQAGSSVGAWQPLLDRKVATEAGLHDPLLRLRGRRAPDDPINGPMDATRFRDELRRMANGRDIRPAEHGMVLGDTEPWPE